MTTTTKTVKSSGGDYSSLSGWEAGQQKSISAGDIEAAECYAFQDTTRVTIDGWTTVATGYIRIYTPSAERHTGVAATGYRLEAGPVFDKLLYNWEQYVRLEGISLKHTASSGNTNAGDSVFRSIAALSGASDVRLTECLITGGAREGILSDGGLHIVANCIVFGVVDGIKSQFSFSAPSDVVYNCTVSASSTGITSSGGTQTVKNCYSNATTEYSSSAQNRTTCAHASAASFSNSTASVAFSTANFTNVTGGSENLHLVSGASSTLLTGGTDLSADGTYAFSVDIDGETRVDWGIGADEYIAAGGATRGMPFGTRGTAFNGGRTFKGPIH